MPALLVPTTAPGATVSLHVLLAGVQAGPLALVGDACEAVVLGLYFLGILRLARRGRHWPAWSTVAFVTGVGAIWVAVGSGLAAYDESSVTMHVVQHVLLMMVAPPLLALGKPVTLASQAAGRIAQVRILKLVHGRAVAALTFPAVAWVLYLGTMYVFFLTPAYRYSVAHPWFHDGTHLWFLFVGYLYWHPLVGLDPARWRWPHPVRIVSLFLGMPFEAFLGIAIAQMPRPIAPVNTLADTHAAGDTLWILSMTTTGLCLAAVVLQWFRQLEREGGREDRRARAATAGNRARAEELGVGDLPEGFTLPWWRLDELEARAARLAAQHPPDDGPG